ncbi:MAG: MBL fold metallo-hydrolase [Clostridiales bacterium]|nr:MBL fold metallo-hydrolase [Clostridiales bacterium]
MIERVPGVFEVKLYGGESSGVSEMRIFIIPGRNGQRSLMVDAGFRRRSCMRDLEAALYELEIDVRNLDIFLTHKHTDHCGLASEFARKGARLFMNPQEERHSYDCLYYSHSLPFREGRAEVLRTIGISPEMRPEL